MVDSLFCLVGLTLRLGFVLLALLAVPLTLEFEARDLSLEGMMRTIVETRATAGFEMPCYLLGAAAGQGRGWDGALGGALE